MFSAWTSGLLQSWLCRAGYCLLLHLDRQVNEGGGGVTLIIKASRTVEIRLAIRPKLLLFSCPQEIQSSIQLIPAVWP